MRAGVESILVSLIVLNLGGLILQFGKVICRACRYGEYIHGNCFEKNNFEIPLNLKDGDPNRFRKLLHLRATQINKSFKRSAALILH
jgi:hypothetical protein